MKRILLSCCLASCLIGANAQTERGKWSVTPMAGVNLLFSEPLETLCGVTAGAGVDYQVSKRIALSSGLFYSYQRYGFKDLHLHLSQPIPNAMNSSYYDYLGGLNESQNIRIRDGRLVVPFTVSAYVWKGLALKTGIQANFRLHSGIADLHLENSSAYNLPLQRDVINTGHAMHACYFSIPVGISYEYCKFVLDVRYIFGLQNLRADWETEDTSSYNMTIVSGGETIWDSQKVNQLQITLGYRLEL